MSRKTNPERTVPVPYGAGYTTFNVPESRLTGIYRPPGIHPADESPEVLIGRALAQPIGAKPLRERASGKNRITVLTSDHTRPLPSRLTLPPIIRELRAGAPDAVITVLVGTGSHRATTEEELDDRFDLDALRDNGVTIRVHDPDDPAGLVTIGKLPSGAELVLNRLAVETDLLVAEGYMEPHFFAGFSGGRKSVLPGVAARSCVMANHCAALMADPNARTGILDNNPIHADMVAAARMAHLAFILNVVLDPDHTIAAVFAGHPEEAHSAGCRWLSERSVIHPDPADIVITGNGGHPLDRDIYQSVKSMTAAEACCRPGGVIIEVSRCIDGHGGEAFFKTFAEGDPDTVKKGARPTPAEVLAGILARPVEATIQDQWQCQILARILDAYTVILLSEAPPEMVRAMGMHPASTPEEALCLADSLLGVPDGHIAVIPDGVTVIAASGNPAV